jgi:hypothetical protein
MDSPTAIRLPVSVTDPLVTSCIENLLDIERAAKIIKFYDRDPTAINWYYQLYRHNPVSASFLPVNSIASILSRAGEVIRGDVVVVKNGPSGEEWEWEGDVDVDALVQTLWWYERSGRCVQTVFGKKGVAPNGG